MGVCSMYNRIKQMDFIGRKVSKLYETCEKEIEGSDIEGVLKMNSYFSNMKTVMFFVKRFQLKSIEKTFTGFTTCTAKKLEVIEKFAEIYQDLNKTVEKYNKDGLHIFTKLASAFNYENSETFNYLIDELKLEPKVEGYHGRDKFLTDLNMTKNPTLEDLESLE